jgi:hypothetical protein
MHGIMVSFDEEVWIGEKLVKIDLAAVLAAVLPITLEVQTSYVFSYGGCTRRMTIAMKWSWEFLEQAQQALFPFEKDFDWAWQEYGVCEHDGCFAEVAAASYCLGTDDVFLFDWSGEEPARLHLNCRTHCPVAELRRGNTLMVTNLTPGQEYWEKVLSWKMRTCYYSQRVEKTREGEYETGYHDEQSASPYLGPFASREEAIGGATDYEFL